MRCALSLFDESSSPASTRISCLVFLHKQEMKEKWRKEFNVDNPGYTVALQEFDWWRSSRNMQNVSVKIEYEEFEPTMSEERISSFKTKRVPENVLFWKWKIAVENTASVFGGGFEREFNVTFMAISKTFFENVDDRNAEKPGSKGSMVSEYFREAIGEEVDVCTLIVDEVHEYKNQDKFSIPANMFKLIHRISVMNGDLGRYVEEKKKQLEGLKLRLPLFDPRLEPPSQEQRRAAVEQRAPKEVPPVDYVLALTATPDNVTISDLYNQISTILAGVHSLVHLPKSAWPKTSTSDLMNLLYPRISEFKTNNSGNNIPLIIKSILNENILTSIKHDTTRWISGMADTSEQPSLEGFLASRVVFSETLRELGIKINIRQADEDMPIVDSTRMFIQSSMHPYTKGVKSIPSKGTPLSVEHKDLFGDKVDMNVVKTVYFNPIESMFDVDPVEGYYNLTRENSNFFSSQRSFMREMIIWDDEAPVKMQKIELSDQNRSVTYTFVKIDDQDVVDPNDQLHRLVRYAWTFISILYALHVSEEEVSVTGAEVFEYSNILSASDIKDPSNKDSVILCEPRKFTKVTLKFPTMNIVVNNDDIEVRGHGFNLKSPTIDHVVNHIRTVKEDEMDEWNKFLYNQGDPGTTKRTVFFDDDKVSEGMWVGGPMHFLVALVGSGIGKEYIMEGIA